MMRDIILVNTCQFACKHVKIFGDQRDLIAWSCDVNSSNAQVDANAHVKKLEEVVAKLMSKCARPDYSSACC